MIKGLSSFHNDEIWSQEMKNCDPFMNKLKSKTHRRTNFGILQLVNGFYL